MSSLAGRTVVIEPCHRTQTVPYIENGALVHIPSVAKFVAAVNPTLSFLILSPVPVLEPS